MPPPKRTCGLHVNILPEQKDWLETIARQYNLPESAVVRAALTLMERSADETFSNDILVRDAWASLSYGDGMRRSAGRA